MSTYLDRIPSFFLDRLSDNRISSDVVRDSKSLPTLPILFFGDILQARIVTIGLNPSWKEYRQKQEGEELDGASRRFETLNSLAASSRDTLSREQKQRAIEGMHHYFHGNPYNWFNSLRKTLQGMGYSYEKGDAAHLDLIQEATDPVWVNFKRKDPLEFDAILRRDTDFLYHQIMECRKNFQLRTLLCTSRTVTKEVCKKFGAKPGEDIEFKKSRKKKSHKLTYHITHADTEFGRIGIAGWNQAPSRMGLNAEEFQRFGSLLKCKLDETNP